LNRPLAEKAGNAVVKNYATENREYS